MRILIKEKLSENKYKTPEGYLVCVDAILARTGKQQYRKNEIFLDSDDDSIIDVDRPEEEVFNEKTITSFENKPFVNEHPDEDVNVHNHRDYAVGFVRDVHRGKVDGKDVLLGNIIVTDEETIAEIESGKKKELSCGYDCDIKDEENPCQRNIRGNHVALCKAGRAGIAKIQDSVGSYTTQEIKEAARKLHAQKPYLTIQECYEKVKENIKNGGYLLDAIEDSFKPGQMVNYEGLKVKIVRKLTEKEKNERSHINNPRAGDYYEVETSSPFLHKSTYIVWEGRLKDSVQDSNSQIVNFLKRNKDELEDLFLSKVSSSKINQYLYEIYDGDILEDYNEMKSEWKKISKVKWKDAIEDSIEDSEYNIKKVEGHYEIVKNGKTYESADTFKEAEQRLEELENKEEEYIVSYVNSADKSSSIKIKAKNENEAIKKAKSKMGREIYKINSVYKDSVDDSESVEDSEYIISLSENKNASEIKKVAKNLGFDVEETKYELILRGGNTSMYNKLKHTVKIVDSVEDKLIAVEESYINELKRDIQKMGFKVVSVKKYLGGEVHFQILSNEGDMDKDDLKYYAEQLNTIDDKFGRYKIPMTYNIGLQYDGYISAGIDLRQQYVKDSVEDSIKDDNYDNLEEYLKTVGADDRTYSIYKEAVRTNLMSFKHFAKVNGGVYKKIDVEKAWNIANGKTKDSVEDGNESKIKESEKDYQDSLDKTYKPGQKVKISNGFNLEREMVTVKKDTGDYILTEDGRKINKSAIVDSCKDDMELSAKTSEELDKLMKQYQKKHPTWKFGEIRKDKGLYRCSVVKDSVEDSMFAYKGYTIEELIKTKDNSKVYQFETKDGDVLTFKSLEEAKSYIDKIFMKDSTDFINLINIVKQVDKINKVKDSNLVQSKLKDSDKLKQLVIEFSKLAKYSNEYSRFTYVNELTKETNLELDKKLNELYKIALSVYSELKNEIEKESKIDNNSKLYYNKNSEDLYNLLSRAIRDAQSAIFLKNNSKMSLILKKLESLAKEYRKVSMKSRDEKTITDSIKDSDKLRQISLKIFQLYSKIETIKEISRSVEGEEKKLNPLLIEFTNLSEQFYNQLKREVDYLNNITKVNYSNRNFKMSFSHEMSEILRKAGDCIKDVYLWFEISKLKNIYNDAQKLINNYNRIAYKLN